MTKKEEKKYLNKYWRRMRSHIRAFLKTADHEELHQFRVQVKKLSALVMMLDSASKKHAFKKDIKPVRKVFKEAGEIRNAYVNLELSGNYHIRSEEFEKLQQDIMSKGIKRFNAKGDKVMRKLKRSHHRLHKDIRSLRNKNIVNFYQQNIAGVAVFLENIQFNHQLHNCRKKIKLLLYNQKPAGSAVSNKVSLNTEYLDKLQESIGKWHDNVLAMDLFQQNGLGEEDVVLKLKENDNQLKADIMVLAADFKERAMFTPDDKPTEAIIVYGH